MWRMEIESIAQDDQIPAPVLAFVHGHHGHVSKQIPVDGHANIQEKLLMRGPSSSNFSAATVRAAPLMIRLNDGA
jgi:hypothetical protein